MKMESVRPMTADLQGMKKPQCAKNTSTPTCFRYTDLPA